MSVVYFIASSESGIERCKIGFTTGDPNKRLAALQSGSPTRLGIYCAIPGSKATEKLFHDTFSPLRLHGEWFAVRHKLLDFLLVLMDSAMERRPADWLEVFEAIELVVLADGPIKAQDDKDEYLASANTEPWEWMRLALAQADAEAGTLQ